MPQHQRPDPDTYADKVRRLVDRAPKLQPTQVRKLAATFGGGPR